MKTGVVKKTYKLDRQLVAKVRRLFKAKTTTEAVKRAIREAVENREIEKSLDKLLKEGRFRTVYR
jgi:Arc/MetJ family transcription regulator